MLMRRAIARRAALFDALVGHRLQLIPTATFWGRILQEGLYKVEFHTVHGTGTGVIYATAGKLRGGNSAFAFIGSYTDESDGMHVKVIDTAPQSRSGIQAAVSAPT